ncbi:MAG: hypothetical protein ACO32I_07395, partial [Candidatus Limnocylindrus sp.]
MASFSDMFDRMRRRFLPRARGRPDTPENKRGMRVVRLDDTIDRVYAIGDVAGPPMLAHKGSREGHVVADILGGAHHHPVNYGNVPNATYCHPEVASIGMTEAQV